MSDMSHEQMLLGKYHKMVDKANNEAWKVEELEKRNKELLVSKNALYKEVEELKAENEKLKETNNVRFDKIKEMENEVGVSKLVHHQNLGLLEDNKKLKECLLSYWSDGKLGNHAAWTPPATWQIMLDEAEAKEPRTKS